MTTKTTAQELSDRANSVVEAISDLPSDLLTGHALLALGIGLLRAENVPGEEVRRLVAECLAKGDADTDNRPTKFDRPVISPAKIARIRAHLGENYAHRESAWKACVAFVDRSESRPSGVVWDVLRDVLVHIDSADEDFAALAIAKARIDADTCAIDIHDLPVAVITGQEP